MPLLSVIQIQIIRCFRIFVRFVHNVLINVDCNDIFENGKRL